MFYNCFMIHNHKIKLKIMTHNLCNKIDLKYCINEIISQNEQSIYYI